MPHNPVHSSDNFRGKSANGGYGDAVEEIDWSTGEILRTLKKLDIDDHTLVVFTSDNGASHRFGGSNAPLRGHKAQTWEGGMRVPCVMRWPGRIPPEKTCDELCSTMDLLPTFAKLAHAKLPADRIIDGKDIWPLMTATQNASSPYQAFYYYFREQLQAVRSGKWKLHLARPSRRRGADPPQEFPVQLYDLDTDIAETTNVAVKHPDVVHRLLTLAEKARTDLGDGDREGMHQRPAGLVANPKPLLLLSKQSNG